MNFQRSPTSFKRSSSLSGFLLVYLFSGHYKKRILGLVFHKYACVFYQVIIWSLGTTSSTVGACTTIKHMAEVKVIDRGLWATGLLRTWIQDPTAHITITRYNQLYNAMYRYYIRRCFQCWSNGCFFLKAGLHCRITSHSYRLQLISIQRHNDLCLFLSKKPAFKLTS